jgi:hypothetical protein
MKFFLLITLASALFLSLSTPFGPNPAHSKRELPRFWPIKKGPYEATFASPENAHVSWAFMSGEKKGVTPRTLNDLKALELGFLFSPSGLHFTTLFFLILFLRKKIPKKLRAIFQIVFLLFLYQVPFLAIKRIVLLRLLILMNRKLKHKLSLEILFFITFGIAFILGHFNESPMGFILSFLYIGTFIALRDQSRIVVFLGLLASHVLWSFFNCTLISPLALLLNLPLLSYFSLLMPMQFFYCLSFKWMTINWLEPLIRFFVLCVHCLGKFAHANAMTASLPLLIGVWMIMLKKPKGIFLCLLLHSGLSQTPTITFSGSYSPEQATSARK